VALLSDAMHLVTYSIPAPGSREGGEKCSWCELPARFKIDRLPEHLIDYACEEHMVGDLLGQACELGGEEAIRDWLVRVA